MRRNGVIASRPRPASRGTTGRLRHSGMVLGDREVPVDVTVCLTMYPHGSSRLLRANQTSFARPSQHAPLDQHVGNTTA